jgi:hypothetical protein
VSAFALAVATAPGARAATKAAVTGGYYWADQPAPAPSPIGQPAGNLANPSVPTGDWAVAARNDQSNMETYIHIDLSAFPAGGTASSFILHVEEDTSATSAANTAGTAAIDAVVIHEYYGDGVVARPYGERPEVPAGAVKVHGTRSTTGDWTWDVTSFVSECLAKGETACGIGLLPGTGTFQVDLVGSDNPNTAGNLYLPYGEGDVAPSSTTGTTADTSLTTTTTDTTPTTTAPSVVPTTPTPTSPVTAAIDNPAPAPAAPRLVAPTPRRTAATGGKADHALPFVFFLAGLGVVALLGASAVTLGEAGEPMPARSGRVFSKLDQRLAGTSDEAKE